VSGGVRKIIPAVGVDKHGEDVNALAPKPLAAGLPDTPFFLDG